MTEETKGGAKAPLLADALRELGQRQNRPAWEVDAAVHDLLISTPWPSGFGLKPGGNGGSTRKQAVAELEAVNKAAAALKEALDNLHGPAWTAITVNTRPDWYLKTKIDIGVMEVLTRPRSDQFEGLDIDFLEKPTKKSKDARMHIFSMKVALWYEFFSEKKATIATDAATGRKHSEYLEFSARIFEILDINKPPRYWAEKGRKLLAENRNRAAQSLMLSMEQAKQFIVPKTKE